MKKFFKGDEIWIIKAGITASDDKFIFKDEKQDTDACYQIFIKKLNEMGFAERRKYFKNAYDKIERLTEKGDSMAIAYLKVFGFDAYMIGVAQRYSLETKVTKSGKIEVCGDTFADYYTPSFAFRDKLKSLGVKSRDGILVSSGIKPPENDEFDEEEETLPNIDDLYN